MRQFVVSVDIRQDNKFVNGSKILLNSYDVIHKAKKLILYCYIYLPESLHCR
jgi:hypothetical protein